MSAAALFAPVLQDRGRAPWVLHSAMDIKCPEHPSETQLTTVVITMVITELRSTFFSV